MIRQSNPKDGMAATAPQVMIIGAMNDAIALTN